MLVAYICHVKRLQIYIDEDVDRALAVEARRRRTSKAALIREYVAEHLRQPGPDPVDAFVGSFVGKPTCPRPSTTWFTESTNDLRRHVLLGCTWQRRRRSARHREEVVGQQTARGDDLQPCPGRDLDAAQPALRSPRGGCRRYNRLSTVVRVEHVTADLEEQAWEWLVRHDEREYSFVDATSFAVMRKKGIQNAYAFDGDFSAAGFVEVRPE